ncbi:alginate O-acetyltransferase AlgX-related protein [Umezawaea beigongshangensis]|uniref:alginate O-acetyltransferase AlgX-related protein n=1 Tax=Umezawaea beigongshangensis TaxID=2780383 RepID=UPI0018F155B3|nr:hypothetical protein [Umezawaea beigongshangensis]
MPPLHESFLPREHGLYRPRHGTRQGTARGAAVVFFFVPLLLLVLGVRPPAFENRALAAFPSVTDGWGFFTGFDRWATDHLPLRDRAVTAADGISRGVFGEAPKLQRKTDVGPVQAPPAATEPEEDRDTPLPSDYPAVIEGRRGWLYYGVDVQGACTPDLPLDEVMSRLQRLRSVVEGSGRQFVLVVAPNKTTMVPENLPTQYYGSECAEPVRDEFWNRISAEAGAVDLRPALRQAAAEAGAPVYSKYDTHWTHEGGLAMSRAVAEQVKPGVTATWKISKADVSEVPADLPKLLGQSKSVSLQNYDLAPDGARVRSKPVPRPLSNAKRFVQLPGTGLVSTGVAMIGDSFTYYVLSDVVAAFSDITVQDSDKIPADPREVGELLAQQDVVVVEAAERTLVNGTHPLLNTEIVDALAAELAERPR